MTAIIEAAEHVTTPGVYNLSPETYHSDPVPAGSLSSTGARKLLAPSCPAKFRHWADAGEETHKRAFDFGHAAHGEVLGVGRGLVVVDAADWRTKAARAQQEAAYADGRTPILAAEYEQVQAMATALREHPTALALLDTPGKAEQSLFWIDPETGIWCRAMLDYLPDAGDGRLVIWDYKTCRSAEIEDLSKALSEHGYYQQGPWYLDGVEALGLSPGGEPAFVLIFQEKAPPYLVRVVQPDVVALRFGRMRNRMARHVYAQCIETGVWPGYSDAVELLPLPPWAERRHESAVEAGDYQPEGTIG